MHSPSISAIVPTIGRPESLRNLLQSLSIQTIRVCEVLVADGSSTGETEAVVKDPRWEARGLTVRHLRVHPPNAVRQREAAIERAEGELLLLLDDDVVLESDCVEKMAGVLADVPASVAVSANYKNQGWPRPTRPWRMYMRYVLGLSEGEWQGRVVGPLLRFGYYTPAETCLPMEWIGTGKSLIRRAAYQEVGGFSDFFLHRCTMNEDVDLGLKLSRVGKILFCPAALLSHYHAPEGRVSAAVAAEDDLYNRFNVFRRTLNYSYANSLRLALVFFLVEMIGDMWGVVRLNNHGNRLKNFAGRVRAMGRIISSPLRRAPAGGVSKVSG
jgi:GT2 family glycosyltransferase